mmetsp:Transcript_103634/g.317305  ORF Transcript_103634/g.317305 Transcript_103634/m.317305 type:complete len:230 (-) Transcript_103634:246-935(-)
MPKEGSQQDPCRRERRLQLRCRPERMCLASLQPACNRQRGPCPRWLCTGHGRFRLSASRRPQMPRQAARRLRPRPGQVQAPRLQLKRRLGQRMRKCGAEPLRRPALRIGQRGRCRRDGLLQASSSSRPATFRHWRPRPRMGCSRWRRGWDPYHRARSRCSSRCWAARCVTIRARWSAWTALRSARRFRREQPGTGRKGLQRSRHSQPPCGPVPPCAFLTNVAWACMLQA